MDLLNMLALPLVKRFVTSRNPYLCGMLWLVCAMLGGLAAASLTAVLILGVDSIEKVSA